MCLFFWKITRENLKSHLVLVVVLVLESKGPFLLTTVNCILFCRFTSIERSIDNKLKSYIKSIFNAIFCHHFWCFLCSGNVLGTVLKNEEWLLRCYATKFATVRPINLPMKKRYMSINILQCECTNTLECAFLLLHNNTHSTLYTVNCRF